MIAVRKLQALKFVETEPSYVPVLATYRQPVGIAFEARTEAGSQELLPDCIDPTVDQGFKLNNRTEFLVEFAYDLLLRCLPMFWTPAWQFLFIAFVSEQNHLASRDDDGLDRDRKHGRHSISPTQYLSIDQRAWVELSALRIIRKLARASSI